MNPEIKSRWLAKLRDPNAKQAKGVLGRGEARCCLGVLCDVYLEDHPEKSWEITGEDNVHDLFHAQGVLPSTVQSWAGLSNDNPFLDIENEFGEPENQTAAEHNDNGAAFPQIADAIEAQL